VSDNLKLNNGESTQRIQTNCCNDKYRSTLDQVEKGIENILEGMDRLPKNENCNSPAPTEKDVQMHKENMENLLILRSIIKGNNETIRENQKIMDELNEIIHRNKKAINSRRQSRK